MKPDVTQVDSSSHGHAEDLNGAVKVHVKQGVLVMVNAGSGACHFIAQKPDAVVARVRLNLGYRRARSCPGHDGRLHPHGRTDG